MLSNEKDKPTVSYLLNRIAENDERAFSEIFKGYAGLVFKFSKNYIKSKEICNEIVSDVFISIWNNRQQMKNIENLNAYLFVLTRNLAYNYLDKKSRIPELTSDIPVETNSEYLNPEEAIFALELEKQIDMAIESLPERCRLIFNMSRNNKLKYQEIAEILSISENTVHAQMGTAIKRLHNAFKKYILILF